MQTTFAGSSQPAPIKLEVIYEPAGRAREYAARAANLFAGCQHGCIYCYAPSATRKTRHSFSMATPRANILAKLESDLKKLSGQEIEPVLMSFTCDPCQPCEAETETTRKAIKLFRKYNVPFQILTKGGMRAARDFDLYGPKDVFASSLTFIDPSDSAEWEPMAASPEDRFEAIKLAHSKGIKTWASLEPVIKPDQSLQIIEDMHEYVDLFKVGTLNHNTLSKTIDWADFGHRAVSLLKHYQKEYYIKDDLRRYL